MGHSDHQSWGSSRALAAMFSTVTATMMRKPCMIWFLGATLPAMRPDNQEPTMMPPMFSAKNQKNCVGSRCSTSPR